MANFSEHSLNEHEAFFRSIVINSTKINERTKVP